MISGFLKQKVNIPKMKVWKKFHNVDRWFFPEHQIHWFEHYFIDFDDILVNKSDFRSSLRGRISARRWSWMTNESTRTIYSSRKLISRCFKVPKPTLRRLKPLAKLVEFGKIRSAPSQHWGTKLISTQKEKELDKSTTCCQVVENTCLPVVITTG